MIQVKSETGTLDVNCHVRRHPLRSQTQRPVGCESGLGTHISRKDQERAYSKIPKAGARTEQRVYSCTFSETPANDLRFGYAAGFFKVQEVTYSVR